MTKGRQLLLSGVVLVCSILISSCGILSTSPIVITFGAGGAITGELITFTFTLPSGQQGTLFWLFGDGGSASGNPTTHIYALAGTYTVTAIVSVPGPPLTGAVSAQDSQVKFTTSVTIGAGGDAPVTPYIYWANGGDDNIGRANLDGTAVNNSFISTADSPFGVAVDNNYIYWSSADKLGRASLDGSGINNSFILSLDCCALGVAVDSSYIYFAWDEEYIARASLDGTGLDMEFVDINNFGFAAGVAVNGSHIFWTDSSTENIGRANLDGTGVNASFITTNDDPSLMAIDDTHIYFVRPGDDLIAQSTLDGTVTVHNYIITGFTPKGVAVYGDYIYWTNQGDNTIGRVKKDGSEYNNSFISTGLSPRGIAVGP